MAIRYTARDVAEYFLSTVEEDAGELISNLKLQKLVYYAQGVYLAMYGEPLFREPIHAWAHGPVVPSLYDQYKQYGDQAIPSVSSINLEYYDQQVREVLDEVMAVFGQFSAWKLRNMTHDEPPWKNTFARRKGAVIPNDLICEYFKTIVTND